MLGRIIVSVGAILAIGVLTMVAFASSDVAEGLIIEGSQQEFDLEFEETTDTECFTSREDVDLRPQPVAKEFEDMLDGETICIDFIVESILENQPKIAESDDNLAERFLDDVRYNSIEQLGIETVVVKKNNQGQQETFSSILPIPTTGNIADEGFFIDDIQVAFFALIKEPVTSVNLEGDVSFFLNNDEIKSKKLWISSSGLNQNEVPFKIVDFVPPPFDARPETFDFTFLDEDFPDGSTQVFRVVINSLQGNYQSDEQSRNISWSGEFIAYEITMTVDQQRTIITNESGDVVPVLKADSAVIVCASGEWLWKQKVSNTLIHERIIPATTSKTVFVDDSDGNEVGRINSFDGGIGKKTCLKIEGIQRDTDITIVVDGQKFPVHTPVSQYNYIVNFGITCATKCIAGDGTPASLFDFATSNFGYEFSNKP